MNILFFILPQVFGGCCSNVFVLENILANNTSNQSLGTIITFSQFLCVSIFGYYANIDVKNSHWYFLYLKKPAIPLHKWFFTVVLFFFTSVLNNLVWKFNITVPFHIIFRSSGTVVTMIVGYLYGNRRYTRSQVLACIIITLGTLMATLPNTGKNDSPTIVVSSSSDGGFTTGITLLTVGAVLASFMGLYNEQLYVQYGNHWQEGLFYSHFLGLPLFVFVASTIKSEYLAVWNDRSTISIGGHFTVPSQLASLVINVLTQFVCIRGVNMLAGRTTALTVTVVLLVRKFVSLFISILWFKNELTKEGMVGAVAVFGGAAFYSISSNSLKKKKVKIQ
ncbi:golgi uridine diphosphate-N- acetylglucosamine transporter [Scheffersomyces stipitis CBS 6054]|uniref:Golgi uridine diphosphate-N-acetylglucosamine transporter n=1 Tax=Scheffersomyces stipitis (strain ATCC 58785 / CBS 6054 / NBRC 10063 / NRRL Y-11545) TaxID=322104 RepID=A3LU25_PICST|nr:golgi uridine diphosphate-N- acetylglucosamine transporter [Scheffersomyces stipitis CBS 6054]ABN66511.2 golgi uridine diphosphate-N- acetylglucosamine transporter [Scheffersomyces stipitis CBS 6054]